MTSHRKPWIAVPEERDRAGHPWPNGRWKVEAPSAVDGGPRVLVACMLSEGDAKLIASAPRLLRERDYFRDALERIQNENGSDGKWGQIAGEAIGMVENG